MADYFTNISNGFTPVDSSVLDLVPPGAPFVTEVPSELEVFTVLKDSKKTSSVPHDFPTTFVKEFLSFLAKPVILIIWTSIYLEFILLQGDP